MYPQIEIVVEDCEGAKIAAQAGADSIELCVDLDQGGLTPPANMMSDVCASVHAINPQTQVHILILNKPDGFYPQPADMDALTSGIEAAAHSGADGVVFGALTSTNRVEASALKQLLAVSKGMKTTFHRAFDRVTQQAEDLELLIELGFTRLLTSGLPGKAADHTARIKQLVDQAAGRLLVVAGGGVRAHNVLDIAEQTGVRLLHGSCRFQGVDTDGAKRTDPAQVRTLVGLCRSLHR